jgi:hypothetical protein
MHLDAKLLGEKLADKMRESGNMDKTCACGVRLTMPSEVIQNVCTFCQTPEDAREYTRIFNELIAQSRL